MDLHCAVTVERLQPNLVLVLVPGTGRNCPELEVDDAVDETQRGGQRTE